MKKLMLQGAVAAIIGAAALAAHGHHGFGLYGVQSRRRLLAHHGTLQLSPAFGVVVHDDNWRWRGRPLSLART